MHEDPTAPPEDLDEAFGDSSYIHNQVADASPSGQSWVGPPSPEQKTIDGIIRTNSSIVMNVESRRTTLA